MAAILDIFMSVLLPARVERDQPGLEALDATFGGDPRLGPIRPHVVSELGRCHRHGLVTWSQRGLAFRLQLLMRARPCPAQAEVCRALRAQLGASPDIPQGHVILYQDRQLLGRVEPLPRLGCRNKWQFAPTAACDAFCLFVLA